MENDAPPPYHQCVAQPHGSAPPGMVQPGVVQMDAYQPYPPAGVAQPYPPAGVAQAYKPTGVAQPYPPAGVHVAQHQIIGMDQHQAQETINMRVNRSDKKAIKIYCVIGMYMIM